MLAEAIPIGLLIGVSLGALGGGGSILTVPALVFLLHQDPHAATTGSLLIVGITALAGMAAHWRDERVRFGAGIGFGVIGVAGSYVGSRLSASVNPHALLAGFSVVMAVAAAAMIRRRHGGGTAARRDDGASSAAEPDPADRGPVAAAGGARTALLDRPSAQVQRQTCPLPSPTPRRSTCRAVKVVAAATAVGFLTGFFGVGGGFVIVPALVLALGYEMPVAVGTSLLVIAVNSAAALAARVGAPTHLDLPMLATFTTAAVVGSLAGNRIASRVDAAKLAGAFVVLLLAVAAYTAARSVPPW